MGRLPGALRRRGGLLLAGLCAMWGSWGMSSPAPAGAQAPMADAAALIAPQQQRLGSGPGSLLLDRPARLDAPLTLAVGQSLRIEAPLQLGVHAAVHLRGRNEVRCDAPVTADGPLNVFVTDGGSDVAIRDCDVTVTGTPGGTLLSATRAARVTAEGNHLVNMALFTTANPGYGHGQTTDVTLNNNAVAFPKGGGPIGIYLMYVVRATVAGNRLSGTAHGIEWWGGNADNGWRSAAEVTGAGEMSITGNQCTSPGGACVRGSMGFDITVSGNTATDCSDVCFDTEGGVRNLFTGNVARHCTNGCYAAEFESEDATFSGNFAYADAHNPTISLFLIKHPSGRPFAHERLTITGNTVGCATLCSAFYSEGADGLVFANNTLGNAVMSFANYSGTTAILGNSFRFTVPLAGHPALSAPTPNGGHSTTIADNLVVNEGGAEAGLPCIAQGWSDFNNTDEMRLLRNTCTGFAVGIATVTNGGNPGAPHAVWLLEGNRFPGTPEAQQLVHQRLLGNESYTVVPAAR